VDGGGESQGEVFWKNNLRQSGGGGVLSWDR